MCALGACKRTTAKEVSLVGWPFRHQPVSPNGVLADQNSLRDHPVSSVPDLWLDEILESNLTQSG